MKAQTRRWSLKPSHKTRLLVITSASVGMVLAVVFASIVYGVRQKVLFHKEAEMRLAMRGSAFSGPSGFSLEEFHQAFPTYSAALFSNEGRMLRSVGPLSLAPVHGFSEFGHYVMLGERVGTEHVVVGSGWNEAERGLDDLALILGVLWLPLTLLVGGATWLGAQSVFQPLQRLNEQAAAITGSNLRHRLATQDTAEFGEFADQLNRMLDRIEATVKREEEFASDAAHELRTPLSILRTRIETTLLKPRTAEEYVGSHKALLSEIERLSLLVEALLQSARGKSGPASEIALEPLVRETAASFEDAFRAKGSELHVRAEPAVACILPEELRIVLGNLISNALRFTPRGGRVFVGLEPEDSGARLSVQDEGPGIPQDLQDRVFERFFRGDSGRNREAGGAGIGLSVCKRIVEERGGSILIEAVEHGTLIVCRLASDRSAASVSG